MPKAERVKLEVMVERPMDAKGKGVGYGHMVTYVKEAIEKHGGSAAISGLTGVRVKRIAT
jgi:hypothetical protein